MLAAAAAACGTAAPPRPTTTTTTARPGPPSTASTGPTATTTGSGYLSGFGATEASWAAGHHPDPSSPAGNYWPRLADGRDTYAGVRFVGGRALSYVENLDPPETAADARAVVGDELPPDARVVSDTTTPGGERLVEASPTLSAAIGENVAVEMASGGSSYDPSRVTSLTYSAVPAARQG